MLDNYQINHFKQLIRQSYKTDLPIDSIWKSKVSSDDNFLLDFNLPWRFTIFIQPKKRKKVI